MATLHIVPLLLPEGPALLGPLARAVSRTFGLPFEAVSPPFSLTPTLDPDRAQYDSSRLLARLAPLAGPGDRVLGVAGVDLMVPVLTYVFGEAQLEGPAAIISTFRLDDRLYGLPENPGRTLERAVKGAHHELGHTYGLTHCPDPGCVMWAATYVEEIDLKPAAFCPRCRRGLPADARG